MNGLRKINFPSTVEKQNAPFSMDQSEMMVFHFY